VTTVECDQTSSIYIWWMILKRSVPSTNHGGMLVCTQVTDLRSREHIRLELHPYDL